MTTRALLVFSLLLILATTLYSAWLYPSLPDAIPTHWDLHGQIDGWGSKASAAWFGPAAMGIFLLLMFLLPLFSPSQFEIKSFRASWNLVILILIVMFGFMHVVILQAGLHPGLPADRLMIGGICFFLAAVGFMLGKLKRNFWMGIRTPWTLASEEVWVATHTFAAKTVTVTSGIATVAAAIGYPFAALMLLIGGLLAPVIYSLVLYKTLQSKGAI
ncbi:MAG: DUF1648 domain-containing protein [Armatimonadia bacterium]